MASCTHGYAFLHEEDVALVGEGTGLVEWGTSEEVRIPLIAMTTDLGST